MFVYRLPRNVIRLNNRLGKSVPWLTARRLRRSFFWQLGCLNQHAVLIAPCSVKEEVLKRDGVAHDSSQAVAQIDQVRFCREFLGSEAQLRLLANPGK